jgi:hypothetical protein
MSSAEPQYAVFLSSRAARGSWRGAPRVGPWQCSRRRKKAVDTASQPQRRPLQACLASTVRRSNSLRARVAMICLLMQLALRNTAIACSLAEVTAPWSGRPFANGNGSDSPIGSMRCAGLGGLGEECWISGYLRDDTARECHL